MIVGGLELVAAPRAAAGAVVRLVAGQGAQAGAGSAPPPDVAGVFAEGEEALRAGELQRAEGAFKKVLAADPNAAGAYANLGVIAMRRQQWGRALEMLRKAERLAPNVAGGSLYIWFVFLRADQFF